MAHNHQTAGANPAPATKFRDSTAVVQLAVNQLVGGSIPPLGAKSDTVSFLMLTCRETC